MDNREDALAELPLQNKIFAHRRPCRGRQQCRRADGDMIETLKPVMAVVKLRLWGGQSTPLPSLSNKTSLISAHGDSILPLVTNTRVQIGTEFGICRRRAFCLLALAITRVGATKARAALWT